MQKFSLILMILIAISAGCTLFTGVIEQSTGINTGVITDVTDKVNLKTGSDRADSFLSNIIDDKASKLGGELKGKLRDAVTKFSESYNTTDFNYAISFGDNSTPYESKGNFKQAQSFALYLGDPNNLVDANPETKGQNFNYGGEIFYVSNKYKLSENSFHKALNIYNDAGLQDSSFAMLTVSNLGLLYHTMGRYSLSEEYTKNALNQREISENKTGYAASLNNISMLYKDMGLYTESEENINKAQKYLENEGSTETMNYAVVLNNKAMLYQLTGKYKEAEILMNQSLDIASRQIKEKSPTFVRLKVNLALLYQSQKKYAEAEEIYKDAISLKKHRFGTKHPDYAVLLRNIASLYQEMGKYDEAEKYLKEAIDIYADQFGKQHPAYAGSIYDLGAFYQSQNRLDEAYSLLNEAFEVQKSVLSEHHPDLTATRENIAILYWQKGDFKMAAQKYNEALKEYIYQINNYFTAMNEYEKSLFWENIQPKFIRFYNFAIQAEKEVPEIAGDFYNYHIATKALLFNSSRKIKQRILNSGDNDLIVKYQQWQDMKAYLGKLYSYSDEELKEEKINVDSMETVVENLEKELTKSSELFKQAVEQQQISYKDIASKLGKDEGVVEFVRIKEYDFLNAKEKIKYIALVLQNDNSAPKMKIFEDGVAMETNYAYSYQKDIHDGKDMEKYYDYYWQNLDELTKNVKTLYASLDGIYNKVNINTIKLPNGNYILDEKNVLFVTNSKDVITYKDNIQKNTKTASLFGFPNYLKGLDPRDETIPPLPGTKKETETIKNLLKSKSWTVNFFMEDNASEENLKKVKSPYILHIATHGFFMEKDLFASEGSRSFGLDPSRAYENPLLRSGLLMAGAEKTIQNLNTKDNKDNDDGVLNAFEAMVLNLDNTEIVVLSACQTGLGDIKTGEGVYGLQRSFQVAGASSILNSLWEVSDEGTQDLMSAFYKYWLESGNKHTAFRKAQLEIKEKYIYPFYWGAFVMVGK
ncbi:MAG: CHAT domain-containing tetratricopeptide repeat protein [Bacteroidota bacterium]